jgi:succinate dehydrogenase / fumarate reductase, cytochrome b subunit
MAGTLVPPAHPAHEDAPRSHDQSTWTRRARRGLVPSSRTVLASSGCVMLGFVALHLGGNLVALEGAEAFNSYARSLRQLGSPVVGEGVVLGIARLVLAGALVAHVAAHLRLVRQPTALRASPYVPPAPDYAAYPLRVLRVTGGVLLLFVAFHLAQLTFGVVNPAFRPDDPYGNPRSALQSWPIAVAHLVAAAAVGAHLLPGVWTGMRSLGLIRPRTEALAGALAPTVALIAFLAWPRSPGLPCWAFSHRR